MRMPATTPDIEMCARSTSQSRTFLQHLTPCHDALGFETLARTSFTDHDVPSRLRLNRRAQVPCQQQRLTLRFVHAVRSQSRTCSQHLTPCHVSLAVQPASCVYVPLALRLALPCKSTHPVEASERVCEVLVHQTRLIAQTSLLDSPNAHSG
jgi:hypothetical protein